MIRTVFGRRGSGKTTLIKEWVRELSRVLIFDTLAEYGDVAEPYADPDRFLAELDRRQGGHFRLAYQVEGDVSEPFDTFCRAAWIVGDVTAVVDETDLVASPTYIPPMFSRLIRQGRHREVSIVAAARRPAEVTRNVTSQSDLVAAFTCPEPIDQQYLAKYVSQDFAARCAALDRFEYEVYQPWTDSGYTGGDQGDAGEDPDEPI